MAAYEIPFHTKPLDFSVMPYAGYDYVVPSTTVPVERTTTQIRGGLNVKPSPYVTLKVEVSRLLPENKVDRERRDRRHVPDRVLFLRGGPP